MLNAKEETVVISKVREIPRKVCSFFFFGLRRDMNEFERAVVSMLGSFRLFLISEPSVSTIVLMLTARAGLKVRCMSVPEHTTLKGVWIDTINKTLRFTGLNL